MNDVNCNGGSQASVFPLGEYVYYVKASKYHTWQYVFG